MNKPNRRHSLYLQFSKAVQQSVDLDPSATCGDPWWQIFPICAPFERRTEGYLATMPATVSKFGTNDGQYKYCLKQTQHTWWSFPFATSGAPKWLIYPYFQLFDRPVDHCVGVFSHSASYSFKTWHKWWPVQVLFKTDTTHMLIFPFHHKWRPQVANLKSFPTIWAASGPLCGGI